MTESGVTDAPPESIQSVCPRPVTHPVMHQGWHNLASVHWAYDPDVVQALLPDGLAVDTHDNAAYVGLIPFDMRRIMVPGLPAFGWLSTFPETNIRTYVVAPDGRRAVWFCSLDISRLIPALVARVAYGLPYCWADMSISHGPGNTVAYRSRRRWPRPVQPSGADSRVTIAIGDQIAESELTDLERFLTARWALASTLMGQGLWATIDHGPWPLNRADVIECDETLLEAAGLPAPAGAPIALWSSGVEVRIGRPRRTA